MKEIHLLYFAQISSLTQKSSESVQTQAQNCEELYAELVQKYNLNLSPKQIRVAQNDELVPWNTLLVAGDTIAFIPPVSGG